MIISGLQMIMMTVQSTSTLPKLPKHGHVRIQLIVMLWHNFIWLLFNPGYCMVLKGQHGSYPNIHSHDSNHFTIDLLMLWHIVQFMNLRTALGSIPPLTKYWIFVDCQISWHILHGARQGCSINMPKQPESPLYSLCKNSTPIGSGTHHHMWWT
jgi:hypothetical protein